MRSVLLLNATYEPLNVVSVRRAIVLVIMDKAEIVESSDGYIRSETLSLPQPLVIRLVYYVRVPHQDSVALSRRALFNRDSYTCQYCGRRLPKSQLTVDHVYPRSRGGKTAWDNVVCACQRCNAQKGDKTPREAGMRLLKRPRQPSYPALVILCSAPMRRAWDKYVPDIGGHGREAEEAEARVI